MSSEVEICNAALQRLGVARVVSLSEASKAARECNFVYAIERDQALRRHAWSFAITQAQLAADVAPPLHSFANYFTLPTDCLRLLLPSDVPAGSTIVSFFIPNGAVIDWKIHGRKIATNWSAPLDITYIKQVTDPNTMDSLFRDVLAVRIAVRTCKILTDSTTLKESLKDDLKEILAEARRINAMENLPGEGPEDSFITARW